MAKMFYTLEEAAAKLGMGEDEVKKLADSGKLQQFRDRDKLMFKREQVDHMSSSASGSGEFTLALDDDSKVDTINVDTPKPKAGSKTDRINLDAETNKLDKGKGASATGISVFEAGEVSGADPMAQTQITSSFAGSNTDEELTLDSVGSGSGLLDLTRESDDTSLGAVELLEDMGPGGPAGRGEGATVGQASSGIFDSAGGADSAASGMADMDEGGAFPVYAMEDSDPAGDGFGGGMLLGVFGVLVVAAIITLAAMNDTVIGLTRTFAEGQQTFGMWYWVAAIACIVLGLAGYALGRARA